MISSPQPPSGEQFEITSGRHRAVVVEVGGGVRRYDVGDVPVLDPYPRDAMCDGAHGAMLAPWPNRLADGRYSFDGRQYQVALTEPKKNNAIHGFLRWRSWRALRHGPDSVVLGTTLRPLQGYPFALDVSVEYQVGGDGLTAATTASNIGSAACPYGLGHHPYLSAGGGTLDSCQLSFDAGIRVDTDAERQLPTGNVPVAGTPFDFSEPRPLGDLAIDYAFTDLPRDGDGRAWVHLDRPGAGRADFWVGSGYPYLELYTGDTLAPDRQRRGLGCEPMTLPPNGFASGVDVIRLEPGESVTTTWGARLAS